VVNRAAKGLKQKSVFHGYETGLELYRKDFGQYPRSKRQASAFGSGQVVCGGQHLAEALVGRDMEGFDPETEWCGANEDPIVYTNDPKSVNRRKPLYIEMKDDGAYALEDVYGAGNIGNIFSPAAMGGRRAPVMTDIFRRNTVKLSSGQSVKMGTPILYFLADASTKKFMGSDPMSNHANWIYNYEDNREIIELGTVQDQTQRHQFDQRVTVTEGGASMSGMAYFYKKLMNPQFHNVDAGGNPISDKPFNANKFILMSAGWDGVFGTRDDVTNFDY